jgi:hypothetical protein
MTDAGMPMPALVFWMLMPTYANKQIWAPFFPKLEDC